MSAEDEEPDPWLSQAFAIREAEEVGLLASALEATAPVDGCPLPGENHPAVAEYAAVAFDLVDRPEFLVPVMRSPCSAPFEESGPNDLSYQTLRFQQKRAHQSFFPEYGAWVWPVWVDPVGRYLTGPAEWIENPNAAGLPPWGRPSTGR